jgi:xylulokinase
VESAYCLNFDLGTSSLKAVLYDVDGGILYKDSVDYQYETPQRGWAEFNPQHWEDALWTLLQRIGEKHPMAGLKGISFTGQMHSFVMLDEKSQVLEPCILWLDRRAQEETSILEERLGLPSYVLNSTYSLPKMYWISRHMPEVVKQVDCILWPKDYIRYKLTGMKATEATEGLGAGLLNWDTREFDTERLKAIDWKPDVLPTVLKDGDNAGEILPAVAEKYGINPDVKIFAGAGDILALLGGAPHKKGRLVYSFGSSSMFFAELGEDDQPENKELYKVEIFGSKLYGGVSSTTGASLMWAYENIWEKKTDFPGMIDAAQTIGPGSDGLVFIPYLSGERSPYWSDSIRGGFYGLELAHKKEHLLKAVLEGICFGMRQAIDIYRRNGIEINEIAVSAGGVRIKGFVQMVADICQVKVSVYSAQETVTNVLFAMAKSSLEGLPFKSILAESFQNVETVEQDSVKGLEYQEAYETFLSFSKYAYLKN